MSYVYVIITLINFYLWKDYGSYVRNKHHIDKICPKADILDPFHLCKQDTNLNNNNNKRIDKEIKNVIPLACSSNYINKVFFSSILSFIIANYISICPSVSCQLSPV